MTQVLYFKQVGSFGDGEISEHPFKRCVHYDRGDSSASITIKDDDRWRVKVIAEDTVAKERLADVDQDFGYYKIVRTNEAGPEHADRSYTKEIRFTVTEDVHFEDPHYIPEAPTYAAFSGNELDADGNAIVFKPGILEKYQKDYDFFLNAGSDSSKSDKTFLDRRCCHNYPTSSLRFRC